MERERLRGMGGDLGEAIKGFRKSMGNDGHDEGAKNQNNENAETTEENTKNNSTNNEK
jgi:sec-independent protein translocase protein TatA